MLAKISITISVVLAIAVGYLLYKTSAKSSSANDIPEVKVAEAFTAESGAKPTVLAYLNGDTLNQNYKFIVEKSAHLEEKMKAAEERVKRAYGPRQQEWEELMQYAQSTPDMSEKDSKIVQERMAKLQMEMDEIQERETGVLRKKEEELQTELQTRVNKYLENYSKQRGIDYVINYQSGLNVMLYGSSAYDVTEEVIAGLNKEYAAEQESEKK